MATNQTNYDKYERLLQLYLEARPSKKRSDGYTAAQNLWKNVRSDKEKYNREIISLKSKKSLNKSKTLNFFNAPPKKKKKSNVTDSILTDNLEFVNMSDSSSKPSEATAETPASG